MSEQLRLFDPDAGVKMLVDKYMVEMLNIIRGPQFSAVTRGMSDAELNDAAQEACIAVIRADGAFNLCKNVKFVTYAFTAIHNAIRQKHGAISRGCRVRSKRDDNKIESAGDDINTMAVSRFDHVKQSDNNDIIECYKKLVTPKVWRAIAAVYLKGCTPREYAKRCGVKVLIIEDRIRRGIAKIRAYEGVKDHEVNDQLRYAVKSSYRRIRGSINKGRAAGAGVRQGDGRGRHAQDGGERHGNGGIRPRRRRSEVVGPSLFPAEVA